MASIRLPYAATPIDPNTRCGGLDGAVYSTGRGQAHYHIALDGTVRRCVQNLQIRDMTKVA